MAKKKEGSLSFETVSKDELEELQKKNSYQSDSLKGQLYDKLSELDSKSDPLAIGYDKNSRLSYLKSLIYGFNKDFIDKRKGKLATTVDKENDRIVVYFDKSSK